MIQQTDINTIFTLLVSQTDEKELKLCLILSQISKNNLVNISLVDLVKKYSEGRKSLISKNSLLKIINGLIEKNLIAKSCNGGNTSNTYRLLFLVNNSKTFLQNQENREKNSQNINNFVPVQKLNQEITVLKQKISEIERQNLHHETPILYHENSSDKQNFEINPCPSVLNIVSSVTTNNNNIPRVGGVNFELVESTNLLKSHGVTAPRASYFAKNYSLDRIKTVCNNAVKVQNLRNRAGWICSALQKEFNFMLEADLRNKRIQSLSQNVDFPKPEIQPDITTQINDKLILDNFKESNPKLYNELELKAVATIKKIPMFSDPATHSPENLFYTRAIELELKNLLSSIQN